MSPDITGLIGQYVHGNEPSHHIIYLYSMLGRPDKAAELSNRVLTTLYDDTRTGLSGNEDCGQMSAWLANRRTLPERATGSDGPTSAAPV